MRVKERKRGEGVPRLENKKQLQDNLLEEAKDAPLPDKEQLWEKLMKVLKEAKDASLPDARTSLARALKEIADNYNVEIGITASRRGVNSKIFFLPGKNTVRVETGKVVCEVLYLFVNLFPPSFLDELLEKLWNTLREVPEEGPLELQIGNTSISPPFELTLAKLLGEKNLPLFNVKK